MRVLYFNIVKIKLFYVEISHTKHFLEKTCIILFIHF